MKAALKVEQNLLQKKNSENPMNFAKVFRSTSSALIFNA
jgi:hypothetical protein